MNDGGVRWSIYAKPVRRMESCRFLTIPQWQALTKVALWTEAISRPCICLSDDQHNDDISGYALDPTKEEWDRLQSFPLFLQIKESQHRRAETLHMFRTPGSPPTTHRVLIYPKQQPALFHLLPEGVIAKINPWEQVGALRSKAMQILFTFSACCRHAGSLPGCTNGLLRTALSGPAARKCSTHRLD